MGTLVSFKRNRYNPCQYQWVQFPLTSVSLDTVTTNFIISKLSTHVNIKVSVATHVYQWAQLPPITDVNISKFSYHPCEYQRVSWHPYKINWHNCHLQLMSISVGSFATNVSKNSFTWPTCLSVYSDIKTETLLT